MFNEEDRPKKAPCHDIGQDLSMLSIEEIDLRIAMLREEIDRLGEARAKKEASRGAADALFRNL